MLFESKDFYSLKGLVELKSIEANWYEIQKDKYILKVAGTETTINHFFKDRNIKVSPYAYIDGKDETKIFPESKKNIWNQNNYGEVIVPYSGMSIYLNEQNLDIYASIIEKYEEQKKISFGDYYIFEKNYYFVMGDNRMQSIDSRYFGFIPQEDILGKVIYSIGI